mgnify:CR=1 FL=1
MAEIKPRFEFRTWAKNFGLVEQKMRALSPCAGIRESGEIYIVSAANNENNTKVRDRLMDIKVYVQEKDGLEQWNPRMKGEFPMSAAALQADVFPAFGVEMPTLKRAEYTLDQYLDEVIRPHSQLAAVRVFKRRFAFRRESNPEDGINMALKRLDGSAGFHVPDDDPVVVAAGGQQRAVR